MKASRTFLMALTAAFFALAAIAARATDTSAPPLGQNLAGENCRADGAASSSKTQTIYCGSATDIAGQLTLAPAPHVLPQGATARQAAILAAAKTLVDPSTLRCDDTKALDADLCFSCARSRATAGRAS